MLLSAQNRRFHERFNIITPSVNPTEKLWKYPLDLKVLKVVGSPKTLLRPSKAPLIFPTTPSNPWNLLETPKTLVNSMEPFETPEILLNAPWDLPVLYKTSLGHLERPLRSHGTYWNSLKRLWDHLKIPWNLMRLAEAFENPRKLEPSETSWGDPETFFNAWDIIQCLRHHGTPWNSLEPLKTIKCFDISSTIL